MSGNISICILDSDKLVAACCAKTRACEPSQKAAPHILEIIATVCLVSASPLVSNTRLACCGVVEGLSIEYHFQ